MVKTQATKNAKSMKTTTTKRKVLPMKSQSLKDSVATIGYSAPGVLGAKTMKGSLDQLKERLGGKGAGLVSMVKLGIPVPPAFNLSTSLCMDYLSRGRLPEAVHSQMEAALQGLEKTLKRKFGSEENPLLLSVRSGARVSMPGMMDTILNLGLNTEITEALSKRYPDRARFFWDCYRRLIHMFSSVVLQIDDEVFERAIADAKRSEGVTVDADLSTLALQKLTQTYLKSVQESGRNFPESPWEQLKLAIEAVFRSWNTERAIHYRKLHRFSEDWGTAVTVQAMVFGNLNDRSGTGVVFTRDPSSGEKKLFGEYLINAQGEDVVAGIRTPRPIEQMKADLSSAYRALVQSLKTLEDHFNDAQDVEFTVENDVLYILQTRSAKRSAKAAIENAWQFVKEKRISPKDALQRISFDQIKQLLHPMLKPSDEKPIGRGLPASPGACSGRVAFDPETAQQLKRAEQRVILVRRETSPEDIMGMSVSEGILTATGGMTSHAAVVGRGMGKTCIVGCSELSIYDSTKTAELNGKSFKEGDFITLNGSTGDIYLGELPTEPVTWGGSAKTFFEWADKISKMPVLANADTPEQAKLARDLGAQGIGLCRTEHMFFDRDRIQKFRLMILSEDSKTREKMSDALLQYQKSDFVGILKEMDGLSVCVRLLDPPLHEFLPKQEDVEEISNLAKELSISTGRLTSRLGQLHEVNPMLGHRGCRLGITFPEIYEMQTRALALSLGGRIEEKGNPILKIMLPLIMNTSELEFLLSRLKKVFAETVQKTYGGKPEVLKKIAKAVKWGTMIELPRACVVADEIAPSVDFFSFGTNDLTQTTLGISRDDAAKFVPHYMETGILKVDPFESLDQRGVGRLIQICVAEARKKNSKLEIGICGEHGGDPESIRFFRKLHFNTVSCSPFRVPIARLATAKAEI